MSLATKLALKDAIQAHLADEVPGAQLAEYVIQATHTDGTADTVGAVAYWRDVDAATFHSVLGIVTYAYVSVSTAAARNEGYGD